jgi:hypothetical protein
MCTGRPPFRAANTLAVLRRVSEDTPRPIRESNPEVPEWLVDVVSKLLAKEPGERFQSAAEVEEVLGRHLAQLQHAAWVPAPRVPSPSAAANMPTSVTICPSCGSSLHVPERMVGSIVHCSECGKPFHVEEGSEVIQVARPARWPVRPRFGLGRKVFGCLWIVAGCALLFVLFLFLIMIVTYQFRRLEQAGAVRAPQSASQPIPFDWKNALGWLPAEANVFGAIQFKPFDPLTLDDHSTQAFLRLLVPGKTAEMITPENLGRIHIQGVEFGYYEGKEPADNRIIVHLSGVALDGHKRIVEFIRRHAGKTVRVEELTQLPAANGPTPVLVSSPEQPFALLLANDNSAYLGVSLRKDATASHHRNLLEKVPSSVTIPNGYNSPWIRSALASIPHDACGLFLGEIPDALRKDLTDALHLRVCPRTFVLNLRRQGQGVACSLTLNLDKAGTDRILREDLDKWRPHALNDLQARFPLLKNEPQGSALLGQILNNLHWQSNGGSVQTQIQISAPTLKGLGEALTRLSRSYADMQKQR